MVNGYDSRIPNIFCLKSQQIGHGRAVLASASQASQIAKSGLLGWQELVGPSHVLFARNLNKIYLESLRHTCSSCSVSFAVPFNFIRFLISALCVVTEVLLLQSCFVVQCLLFWNSHHVMVCLSLINGNFDFNSSPIKDQRWST